MTYFSSTLFIIGPLSEAIMLMLLMVLSKRLGHALETPPYYRLYLAAVLFLLLPLPAAWILLLTGAWGLPESDPQTILILKVFFTLIPMAIAITFALLVTAKYWHWVWGELQGSRGKGGGRREGKG